jgi:hypothetical protein
MQYQKIFRLFISLFLLITNVYALNDSLTNFESTFKLNNGLVHKQPFGFVGRIYHYKQNEDCSVSKVYLCNSLMISHDKVISPYDCLNNVTKDLYLLINTKEYKFQHILTSTKHVNSSSNWAILHTTTDIITNTSMLDSLDYAANHIVKPFELKYTYIMGYNKFILNGTTLIVKTCDLKSTNSMVVVKTLTQLPLYYFSWNIQNTLLYNKNNISGEFIIHTRNYTDGVIRHSLICMNSYLQTFNNVSYTSCISVPFLSYINARNVKNQLNMSTYTKYDVTYNNVTNFDSNCQPINNKSSHANKSLLSVITTFITFMVIIMVN